MNKQYSSERKGGYSNNKRDVITHKKRVKQYNKNGIVIVGERSERRYSQGDS